MMCPIRRNSSRFGGFVIKRSTPSFSTVFFSAGEAEEVSTTTGTVEKDSSLLRASRIVVPLALEIQIKHGGIRPPSSLEHSFVSDVAKGIGAVIYNGNLAIKSRSLQRFLDQIHVGFIILDD
jgi:hypothetical protein